MEKKGGGRSPLPVARKLLALARPADAPPALRVMSYNILADAHISPHLYPRHRLKDILGEKRLALVAREIAEHAPDVLCLQELQRSDIGFFSSAEALRGFHCTYAHKRRPDAGSAQEGVALFVRRARLEVLKSHSINFTLRQGENYDKIDLLLAEMSKPCAAVINVLRTRDEAARRFAAVSIHLPFNTKQGHVKLAILCLLFKALEQLKQQHDFEEVLVCGDFNSICNSMIYRFVREARLDLAANLAEYSNQAQLELLLRQMPLAQALVEADRVFEASGRPNRRDIPANFWRLLLQAQPVVGEEEPIAFRHEPDSWQGADAGAGLERLSAGLSLSSAYPDVKALLVAAGRESELGAPYLSPQRNNNEALLTFFGEGIKGCVDYIFYAKKGSLRPVSLLEPPALEALLALPTTLPCASLGSDHLCLLADFAWT